MWVLPGPPCSKTLRLVRVQLGIAAADGDHRPRVFLPQAAVRLIAWHDRNLGDTLPEIRKNISELGEEWFLPLLEVKTSDVEAQSDYHREEKLGKIEYWRNAFEEIRRAGDCLSLKNLAVSGKDLIAAGAAPGKEIGRILHEMLEEVLREPAHNTREYLLEKWQNQQL